MKPHFLKCIIAGSLLVLGVAVISYPQLRSKGVRIDFEKDSGLSVVLGLADDFRRTSNTKALDSLAALTTDPKSGANAIACLAGLERIMTPEQVTSIVIPALVKGLQGSNAAIRRQAAMSFSERVVEFAVPAIPALVVVLEEPTEVVNAAPFAAVTLGRFGPLASNAIPNLLKILERPEVESGGFEDASVRVRAAEAIGRIGVKDAKVCEQFGKFLGDHNVYVRAASAQALLRNDCEHDPAARTLAGLMEVDDTGVRRFAVQVIQALPSTPELLREALKNAMNDPDSEVASAARAILNRRGR